MTLVIGSETSCDLDERIAEHRQISTALSHYDDVRLAGLVGATGSAIGIGSGLSRYRRLARVVKRIPLTDRKRQPDTVGSTANLFGLPAARHYGVGSPGFGAWRELDVTLTTSNWALSGQSERFPRSTIGGFCPE